MKQKDVILDFTSLLDIILIILFFFILYSAFNTKEAEQRAEAARTAYEDRLSALETEQGRLDDEWERIRALDENAVKNQQALSAFNDGGMLSFNLRKEDASDAWQLSATRRQSPRGEEERVGLILPGDDLFNSILQIIQDAGYEKDEVLIISFTYDGSVIGSNRLYREIMRALRDVQTYRKNIYLAAVNTSK